MVDVSTSCTPSAVGCLRVLCLRIADSLVKYKPQTVQATPSTNVTRSRRPLQRTASLSKSAAQAACACISDPFMTVSPWAPACVSLRCRLSTACWINLAGCAVPNIRYTSSLEVCVMCLGDLAIARSWVLTRPKTCDSRYPEHPQHVHPYINVDQMHVLQICARRLRLRHLVEVRTLLSLENWFLAVLKRWRTVRASKSNKEITQPRYSCECLIGILRISPPRKHK